jgi:hypothetical protein
VRYCQRCLSFSELLQSGANGARSGCEMKEALPKGAWIFWLEGGLGHPAPGNHPDPVNTCRS